LKEQCVDNETKDQLNDDYVSIPRLLKGAAVRMLTLGPKFTQLRQTLGNDKFAEFVRTELPLDLREARLFTALASTPGLEAANFTPPIEIKLPRLLEVMGQVVSIWSTINGGTATGPENYVGTAGASEAVSGPDCEGSAEAPVIDDEPQAETNGTAALEIVPATSAMTAAVSDDTADPTVPDTLAGTMDTGSQDTAPTAVDGPVAHQPAITAEQRRFIADRSVTLLVKLTKGEITPEAAMREAEKLPERKGKKSAGCR
jgi:hypothetical protein